tara:strand:+ start:2354 stop:3631 length:1278 start_codon:yes stop_codon:yes gene_type:complete
MFKPATRRGAFIKFAIAGPSGSGKTTGAIKIARGLAGPAGRIALIDTENRSASLYSELTDFDVCDLDPPFKEQQFLDAIKGAEKAGYDVLIIDSFSHLWEAILQLKDQLDQRRGQNINNWQHAGKKFKRVLDAVIHSDLHVICCMRSKQKYLINKDEVSGKTTVQKHGVGPQMREGVEFEFTIVFDLGMSHHAEASKDRTGLFDQDIIQLTEETGETILGWLEGAAPDDYKPKDDPVEYADTVDPVEPDRKKEKPSVDEEKDEIPMDDGSPASVEVVLEIEDLWSKLGKPEQGKLDAIRWTGNQKATGFGGMTADQAGLLLKTLREQDLERAAQESEKDSGEQGVSDDIETTQEEEKWREIVDPEVAVFLSIKANEKTINDYLLEINWLEPGRTWRNLLPSQLEIINEKIEAFAKQAGLEYQKGK